MICLVVTVFPASLIAQTAQVGTVAGEVKDESGASLPGVTVELLSQERGVSRTFVSDMNGRFLFAQVPLGMYRLRGTLSGFQTTTIPNNLVEAQRTTRVDVTMSLAAARETITVTGEVPIVDKTNATQTTRLSNEEFEKLPIGRSYQTLFGTAPGVVGTGNANVHGALSSNNLFMFDGVDVTDPTTGTFASNLNFEAIQEVNIMTAGISAEYGRATGGYLNVITKSGGNKFEGSFKILADNDRWNGQNKRKSELTGAALERTKFDQLNDRYAATLGGPLWRDRAWFFGVHEISEITSPERQTIATNENFRQTTESPFWTGRLTYQITPSHNIWGKYNESPTSGFIVDYWGTNAETLAMTRQDQTAEQFTVQWTGVFTPNLTGEAMWGNNEEWIGVFPYRASSLHNGAPHFNSTDRRYYNGATFEGIVDRPRNQLTGALSYFADIAGNSHQFKFGVDYQDMKSTAAFRFPNDQLYIDQSFDPVTRAFVPLSRRDYDPLTLSSSTGEILSFYARDKFEVGNRFFFEVGARYEDQTGESDVGAVTVDSTTIAPRLSGTYDLTGNGKTLIVATAGRVYQFIVQGFSDSFAEVPQQTNYENYLWNAERSEYVLSNRFEAGARTFRPNSDVDPTYVDEITLGFQRQIGTAMGVGVRGIWREFGDMIDDIFTFNPDGTFNRQVVNYGPARREYTGLELTLDKRFARNWNLLASYTWSETRGNHFANTFSSLGNWGDANCRSTTDPSIGNNGVIPCLEVNDGPRNFGHPPNHRPHNLKGYGAYSRALGPVNLTLGAAGEWISGTRFAKASSLQVLNPVTGAASGQFATYRYEDFGAESLPGVWSIDNSIEGTFRVLDLMEIGIKAEIFNVTDNQEKASPGATTWCNNTTNPAAACTQARDRFNKATVRTHFQTPRTYRITTLLRF
ncbi:MAG TPA: carboxypeptidase regulatory-like domain-containing protein [Thermoanaerobaculia bacterium]|nr:carboxypeptidase regulatory-like domain-containing protein [Thermoanaerobaculia bacterium]